MPPPEDPEPLVGMAEQPARNSAALAMAAQTGIAGRIIDLFRVCRVMISLRILQLEPVEGAEFPPNCHHSMILRPLSGLRNRSTERSSGLLGWRPSPFAIR